MIPVATYGRYLRCKSCGASHWAEQTTGIRCQDCGLTMQWDEGVLVLEDRHRDEATRYYDFIGGPHFIDVTFESNLLVHCVTRKFRQYLDQWFPSGQGALLDLGCGDGRLSLWALERGFSPVIALDTSLQALKRLVKAAESRNLKGLVPVCATFQDNCLTPASFDVVLFIEALCYVTASWGLDQGLDLLRRSTKPDGRAVLCELSRNARLLVDVIAVNVENMAKTAKEKKRWEKMGNGRVECTHTSPAELIAACEKTGFRVLDQRGVSPIPMLFHFAHTFTSYPLRPALDAKMQELIETLDDQTSELNTFSRNTVLLLEPGTK
jgi:SAM-dependent methyltransferase